MELLDGYENENGVFLRYRETMDELVVMDIRFFAPDDEQFAWTLEQLRDLEA